MNKQSMREQVEDTQSSLAKSLKLLFEEQELFAKAIEFFPYPIQIFTVDGTARMLNRAAMEMLGIESAKDCIGKYNVFKDPVMREVGVADQIRQVLAGKTVYLKDSDTTCQGMSRFLNAIGRDVRTIISDIVCFPLINAYGILECFAAVFIYKNIYREKKEIVRGRQYIENHWQEPFDLDETARAACLSKSQFTKHFKKYTGMTPYEYYINYKVGKVKEKLLDNNLSIARAFTSCNMDYNGHSVKIFKNKTGVSPSEYRRIYGHHGALK